MLVPIFNLVTHRPDLIIDHLAGYLKLAQDEVSGIKQQLIRRTIAGAIALVFAVAFIVLAGVAIMLASLAGTQQRSSGRCIGRCHHRSDCGDEIGPRRAIGVVRRPYTARHSGLQASDTCEGGRRMSRSSTPGASDSSQQDVNAQVVLNETRRELREFLMGDPVRAKSGKGNAASSTLNAQQTNSQAAGGNRREQRSNKGNSRDTGVDWMGLVKAGASSWWRDHPLHVGATVLTPIVSDYVRRKPVATLAISAAAGAAFVLIRPWRIASVAALGMTLVRSSNLPVMAASLVATVAENLHKDQS